MKQLEFKIMGQSYLFGCPEGQEQQLTQAAAQVDQTMSKIRDAGKVKARDRIAVLAAVNLAFERASETQKTAATNLESPQEAFTNDQAQLRQLVHRLDEALNQDGQLL